MPMLRRWAASGRLKPVLAIQRSLRSSPDQSARSPMVVPNEVVMADSRQDENSQAALGVWD